MRPAADDLLRGAFDALMTRVLADPASPYGLGSLATIGMLMNLSAEEFDRAADVRVRENTALRGLFREAAALVDDAALAGRLLTAGRGRDGSLRIRDLDRAGDELLDLLIELQTHLEGRGDGAARVLLLRTWDFLRTSAAERLVHLPQLG